jgi:hypothetical protein
VIAAEQLKPWDKDQWIGLFVCAVAMAACFPSARRTVAKFAVLSFVAAVAVETIAPGTVTR